jgi:hypothetical protein
MNPAILLLRTAGRAVRGRKGLHGTQESHEHRPGRAASRSSRRRSSRARSAARPRPKPPPARRASSSTPRSADSSYGYDVDVNGTEGLLCEALTLPNGNHDIAVETFDPSTGAIVKVVRRIKNTQHALVTLGVTGSSVGLVELST